MGLAAILVRARAGVLKDPSTIVPMRGEPGWHHSYLNLLDSGSSAADRVPYVPRDAPRVKRVRGKTGARGSTQGCHALAALPIVPYVGRVTDTFAKALISGTGCSKGQRVPVRRSTLTTGRPLSCSPLGRLARSTPLAELSQGAPRGPPAPTACSSHDNLQHSTDYGLVGGSNP